MNEDQRVAVWWYSMSITTAFFYNFSAWIHNRKQSNQRLPRDVGDMLIAGVAWPCFLPFSVFILIFAALKFLCSDTRVALQPNTRVALQLDTELPLEIIIHKK